MLLKRAARGQLALLESAESALHSEAVGNCDDHEYRLVENAKRLALLCLGAARRKYPDALDQHQEILMHIADMIIEAYVMESALLRARKLGRQGRESIAADAASVLLRDAMARVEISAREVLAAVSDVEALRLSRRLAEYEPVNAIDMRRRIARRLLQAERYVM
jgi:alkylation response protein AidB-like acyl-CoA dehydrogenase